MSLLFQTKKERSREMYSLCSIADWMDPWVQSPRDNTMVTMVLIDASHALTCELCNKPCKQSDNKVFLPVKMI